MQKEGAEKCLGESATSLHAHNTTGKKLKNTTRKTVGYKNYFKKYEGVRVGGGGA